MATVARPGVSSEYQKPKAHEKSGAGKDKTVEREEGKVEIEEALTGPESVLREPEEKTHESKPKKHKEVKREDTGETRERKVSHGHKGKEGKKERHEKEAKHKKKVRKEKEEEEELESEEHLERKHRKSDEKTHGKEEGRKRSSSARTSDENKPKKKAETDENWVPIPEKPQENKMMKPARSHNLSYLDLAGNFSENEARFVSPQNFPMSRAKHKTVKNKDKAMVLWFDEVGIKDVPLVGGKNASLGEMIKALTPKGVKIPQGFATTAHAYRKFIKTTGIEKKMRKLFEDLEDGNTKKLEEVGRKVRNLILSVPLPDSLQHSIANCYRSLCERYGRSEDLDVAVRSSATAEDLPDASFAGQQETYLNVSGVESVIRHCHMCYASLFTNRAISYRNHKKFDHFAVALSVGIQKMVRSDLASAGVMFTLDTETGFKNVVYVTGAFGLGENVVQGAVNPDEFFVFKPTLKDDYRPIIEKRLGTKLLKMIYKTGGSQMTANTQTSRIEQTTFCLEDDEVLKLAKWGVIIEDHYSKQNDRWTPMDIEWAKDGDSKEIYIVQARPETVQSRKNVNHLVTYVLGDEEEEEGGEKGKKKKKEKKEGGEKEGKKRKVEEKEGGKETKRHKKGDDEEKGEKKHKKKHTEEKAEKKSEKGEKKKKEHKKRGEKAEKSEEDAKEKKPKKKKKVEKEVILTGKAVGSMIGSGKAIVIDSIEDMGKFLPDHVLVTDRTDPDWEPIMKQASAIITNTGGRTCHAAIIAREIGIPAIVGASDATKIISNHQTVTVSCAEGDVGKVYKGAIKFHVEKTELDKLPQTKTQIMLNIANPREALSLSSLPVSGVGLTRIEFVIANFIKCHPLALLHFNEEKDEGIKAQIREMLEKTLGSAALKRGQEGEDMMAKFFVDELAAGVGLIAAAFYPKAVIVRLSDFKTNEYAKLLGGAKYEPKEENPMLGWRGASRYYDKRYSEGFALECAALKKAREVMGFKNIIPMVPFCRTVEEGQNVIKEMAKNGLKQSDDLQIYVMCEIPSNVILAEQFSDIFDGFSIGSNDLTQLALGLDRDSGLVAHLFDERNATVKKLISMLLKKAHKKGRKVGICGQAPSDYADFTEFLVCEGIDSISLNSDSVVKMCLAIKDIEDKIKAGVVEDKRSKSKDEEEVTQVIRINVS